MADIDWDMVVAIAGELAEGVSEEGQDIILDYVNTVVNVDLFGGEDHPRTKLIRIYMAAHFGQLEKDGAHGASGTITSRTLGPMSTSYASNSPMGTSPMWDKTIWGQQLRTLLNSSAARVPIVI